MLFEIHLARTAQNLERRWKHKSKLSWEFPPSRRVATAAGESGPLQLGLRALLKFHTPSPNHPKITIFSTETHVRSTRFGSGARGSRWAELRGADMLHKLNSKSTVAGIYKTPRGRLQPPDFGVVGPRLKMRVFSVGVKGESLMFVAKCGNAGGLAVKSVKAELIWFPGEIPPLRATKCSAFQVRCMMPCWEMQVLSEQEKK